MTATELNASAPRLPLLAAICIAPRRTVRWMLDHPAPRRSFMVVFCAVVSLFISDLDVTAMNRAAEALGRAVSLVLALMIVLISLGVAAVMYFGLGATATVAGRLLGGRGTFGEVRTAVAWGFAPQVWALLYRLPFVVFFPEAVAALGSDSPDFQIGGEEIVISGLDLTQLPVVPLVTFALLEVCVLIWYLVIGSRTLAEAGGMSSLRGLANLLLAVVLPFVTIAVILVAAFLAASTT